MITKYYKNNKNYLFRIIKINFVKWILQQLKNKIINYLQLKV